MPSLDEKIERISAEFAELEPRERLELLLEYAEGLPELPVRYHAERDVGQHRVPECMTPVFLWVEVDEGRLQLFAHAAPEAPTVKGFVAILVEALSGATTGEGQALDASLVGRLGLTEALGMQRMRGLQGILFYIRKQIYRATGAS